MKFTVILEPEAEGGYSVSCPALPGCVSEGESLTEALDNIREAIVGILEVRRSKGMAPPPPETPELIADELRETLAARADEGLPLLVETQVVEIGAGVGV